MMPMVFCASFEPWLKATNAAEPVCASRKRRFTTPGCALRKIHNSAIMIMTPTAKPISGAATVGRSTFSTMPAHLTLCTPWVAITAPAMPPIKQCDELLGSAQYQVTRFQKIAPSSPPSNTGSVTTDGSTMPLASVVATEVEISAPTMLSMAAPSSAMLGGIARVEIEVATALAAS